MFISFAGSGKARGRVVLELAVDLIGKEDDVAAGCECNDMFKDKRRHQEAGGIMRRINIDGFGVQLDEFFKGGNIVRPAAFESAAPLANLRAGAAGDLQAALITGRLDDHMIARSDKGVIEHENAFLGGSQDENVAGLDLLVDGGDGFAQPGSTRRLRVAAPVFEEALVSSWLEVQEFLDGAGLGVGTGEQIPGGEFVLAEILFDSKRLDLHAKESGKRTGYRPAPI